jgi:acetolactate synthase-1/2/3 large subunit
VTLGIVADLATAVPALLAVLRARGPAREHGADMARYAETQARWREELVAPIAAWSGAGIHPAHAVRTIGEVFGSEAVYVTDGGNTSLWAHTFLPATRPRSYHSIMELGMLGTGIPSAIGAKLGAPERRVVCVTGDGAAGFHFMEMQTAAREGLPLVVVVCAEGSWTMEELNERMLYGKTYGTAMGTVRWDVVAQGLGCHAAYVERLDDLAPALRAAQARDDGPTVICLRTDRDANLALPPEMMGRFFEVYNGPTPG